MNFYTTTLTSGTFTVDSNDLATMLSVQPQANSSCTIEGNAYYQAQPSSPITISNSNSLTVSASNPTFPLNGILITWVSGTIDIIIGF